MAIILYTAIRSLLKVVAFDSHLEGKVTVKFPSAEGNAPDFRVPRDPLLKTTRNNSGERHCSGTRFLRNSAWQRSNDVTTGLCLPIGIYNRALAIADVLVIPHPDFGIDRLAYAT